MYVAVGILLGITFILVRRIRYLGSLIEEQRAHIALITRMIGSLEYTCMVIMDTNVQAYNKQQEINELFSDLMVSCSERQQVSEDLCKSRFELTTQCLDQSK